MPQHCRSALLAVALGLVLAPAELAWSASSRPGEPEDVATVRTHTDCSQARLMLRFLREVAAGECRPETINQVIASPGTTLIIGQLNIMRQVTPEQYRLLLEHLCDPEPPLIEPVDDSERAARGVTGLQQDVWRALQWGVAHLDLLTERIELVEGIDLGSNAVTVAESFLPEPLGEVPPISVVMGGRAGAAAVHDQLYLDMLVLTGSRVIRNRQLHDRDELIDLVAHELHHIGVHRLRVAQRDALQLDEQQSLALHLLSGLVGEGSATFLISEHGDMDRLRSNPAFAELLERGDELLATCEGVLRGLLQGEIRGSEQYDRATAPLLGSGMHVAGSLLLGALDEATGREAIRKVIADPRQLLVEYSRAAAALEAASEGRSLYRFDPELVLALSHLGAPVESGRDREGEAQREPDGSREPLPEQEL